AAGGALYGGVTSIFEGSIKSLLLKSIPRAILPGSIITGTAMAADIFAGLAITELVDNTHPLALASVATENDDYKIELRKISVTEYASALNSLLQYSRIEVGQRAARCEYVISNQMKIELSIQKDSRSTDLIFIRDAQSIHPEEGNFYRHAE